MNYPKVIFTYINIDGRETTFAKDIIGCCSQCETEKIFDAFQSWANEIGDDIAEKYEEDEDEDITPLRYPEDE